MPEPGFFEGEAALRESQELRRELERSRNERALLIERSQAQEEELRSLKERLAKAEGEQKALEHQARRKEKDFQDELAQAVQRERMLRAKFEDELRRLGRERAASEAEHRETLVLKEKELASSLSLQEQMAGRHQAERKRLEEVVAGHRAELGKLRSVLEALDEKLAKEAAERQFAAGERSAAEKLLAALVQQNNRLSSALEESLRRKDLAEKGLFEELERTLAKGGGAAPGPDLSPRLAEAERDKAALSAEVDRLDAENDLVRRHLEQAQQDLQGLQARASTETKRFEAEEAGLNQRIAYLQEKLVDMQAQIEEELRSRKTHYEEMLGEMKSELEGKVDKASGPASSASPKALLQHLLKLLESAKKS